MMKFYDVLVVLIVCITLVAILAMGFEHDLQMAELEKLGTNVCYEMED
jgi:hypothetical protein